MLFGNDRCATFSAPAAFGESVLPLWPKLQDCDAQTRDNAFAGQSASVVLPGMSAIAASFTSLRVAVADNTRASVSFKLEGHNELRVQNQKLELTGPRCVFIPAGSGPQEAVGQGQNVLMLQLDPQGLHMAARALRGLEAGSPVNLDHGRVRLLTSQMGPSLEALARHIGATIHLHLDQPEMLHRLGFQDFVYRQLVLLFRPDWLTAESRPPRPGSLRERLAVDKVCDAMLAEPGGASPSASWPSWAACRSGRCSTRFSTGLGSPPAVAARPAAGDRAPAPASGQRGQHRADCHGLRVCQREQLFGVLP